jgi:hypothetical protein
LLKWWCGTSDLRFLAFYLFGDASLIAKTRRPVFGDSIHLPWLQLAAGFL